LDVECIVNNFHQLVGYDTANDLTLFDKSYKKLFSQRFIYR